MKPIFMALMALLTLVFLCFSVFAVLDDAISPVMHTTKTFTYIFLFIFCLVVTIYLLLTLILGAGLSLSQSLKKGLKREYRKNPRVIEYGTKAACKIIRTKIQKEKGLAVGLGTYLYLKGTLPPVQKGFVSLMKDYLKNV